MNIKKLYQHAVYMKQQNNTLIGCLVARGYKMDWYRRKEIHIVIRAQKIKTLNWQRRINNMSELQEINLGNGLRLTQSNDMGIFLHYKSKSGKQSGESIKINSRSYTWASELLEAQKECLTCGKSFTPTGYNDLNEGYLCDDCLDNKGG